MEKLPMGDLSAEPSMEEILSSIKRIIAEEGDATPTRQRRQQRSAAPAPSAGGTAAEADEVLELKDPVPQAPIPQAPFLQPGAQSQPAPRPQPAAGPPAGPAPEPAPRPPRAAPEPSGPTTADQAAAEAIVSRRAAESTRGSLESLSRLLVKPEPEGDGTLEGLVREMLRPMLRDWLDANLPEMVQAMVAREIAKITGQQG